MQVDLPTLILMGVTLATIVASFARNETNQKRILERLDRQNGSIKNNTKKIDDHIIECHLKK